MGRHHNPKAPHTPKLRPTDPDSPISDEEPSDDDWRAGTERKRRRFSGLTPLARKADDKTWPDLPVKLDMFPSFLDNNPNSSNANNARLAPSPIANSQQPSNGTTNGVGGGMNGAGMLPMNAGAQMDVNLLYQRVLELSEQLRENREETQGILRGAKELAVGLQSFLVF